jgi:FKBP-type peptidyl-prolyl cis-trans isomerase
MKEGSKMTLIVPSRLAYQGQGFSTMIGPDMPLSFDMELLKLN